MESELLPLLEIFNNKRALRLLDLLTVILIILAVGFSYVSLVDFRTMTFSGLPAHASIQINGHILTTTSIKVRPGSYDVVITSPTTAPHDEIVDIGWFGDLAYTPKLQERSVDAIAGSLLGAIPETSAVPHLNPVRWFESDTWAAGILSPTDIVFVTHYDQTRGQWVVAYCTDSGYPQNMNVLPPQVASYVASLQGRRDQ